MIEPHEKFWGFDYYTCDYVDKSIYVVDDVV